MTIKTYRYPWQVTLWIDGDTCHGIMDEGFRRQWAPKNGLRLIKFDGTTYDAPELRKGTAANRARGAAARAAAEMLAPAGAWYMVTSHSADPDDFGRPLCSIELPDGRDLATVLTEEGHVK